MKYQTAVAVDSFSDATQRQKDTNGNWTSQVTVGPIFDQRAFVLVETETELIAVIVSNIPIDGVKGYTTNLNTDGVIRNGDLLLNFSGKTLSEASSDELYAVRIVDNGDDVEPGLYSKVVAGSVTSLNDRPVDHTTNDYLAQVPDAGDNVFGTTEVDADYFSGANGETLNVMGSGDRLANARILEDTEINGLIAGIDLGEAITPETNVYAIAIDKSALPQGDYIASLIPECGNDIIAVTGSVVGNPSFVVEKQVMGLDADAHTDAAVVIPGQNVLYTVAITNDGDVALSIAGLEVDDPNADLFFAESSDIDADGVLSPDETIYFYSLPMEAQAITHNIDFDTDPSGQPLETGTTITDQFSSIGLTLEQRSDSPHGLMIFNADKPTRDFDLGTPNSDFDGPGVGDGGGVGMPGENSISQDKVLIISQDGDSENPDDYEGGGTFIMKFDRLVRFDQVSLLDRGMPSEIRLFDDSGLLVGSSTIPAYGENSYVEVDLGGTIASSLEVEYPDSGAIAGLVVSEFVENTVVVNSNEFPGLSVSDSAYYIGSGSGSGHSNQFIAPLCPPVECCGPCSSVIVTEQNPVIPAPIDF